jgi:alkylation response protein AidB-like acyl-CoA dehydrogenase
MDLEFDTHQSELRSAVRAVLEKECPIGLVRAVVEGKDTWAGLWDQMVELSWPALTVPERQGGLGLGFVELAVVLEELGRAVAPGPFLPTTTQFLPALREAGGMAGADRYLRAVAAGSLTGSLALVDAGGWDVGDVEMQAVPDGPGWVLDGVKRHVVEGGSVDELVVAARLPGSSGSDGICLFAVPQEDVKAVAIPALDASRQLATVELDAVRIPPERALGTPGEQGTALRRAIDEAALAMALESVGTCQAILDIALEHSKTRHQFGVPIGSFQAMKHKLADMLVLLERARALSYLATAAVAEEDAERPVLVSSAKAAAAEAQRAIAQEGVQALGGIAYTWEHDMHLYVKRAKSQGALFGGAREHLAAVAGLIGLG